MTVADKRPDVRRPAGRRVGYVIAGAIDVVLLYVLNVRPGWEAVPFLTGETTEVLPVVNLSLLVGLVVNALWVAYDPRWLTALGGLATSAVGLAALVRMWQVFPFAFAGSFDWAMVFRILLMLGLVGTSIALIVGVAQLLAAGRPRS